MSELTMDVRSVDFTERVIEGLVAPYDETSYLVGGGGERIRRGAFEKSIQERGSRIPLCAGHDHRRPALGKAVGWLDDESGLSARFQIRADDDGDKALGDARDGYLPALSVGFEPTRRRRAPDGVTEVLEARLHEVSLVAVGAYMGAQVLAVRSAELEVDYAKYLEPFANPPRIDLTPIAPYRR